MWFRFGRISLLLHIEILVTPITRQYFEADGKIHSDQTEHSGTMRRVAADMKVPLIELQDESIAYLEKAGEEAGHKFEITKKDATGATIGGWGPGFCADFTTKIHRGRARDWRSAGAGDVAVAAQLQGWRAGRGPDALC